jgi:hypothetical protein
VDKRQPNDKSVRSDVDQFCGLVEGLKEKHSIGAELLDNRQTRSLMEQTANAFFRIVTGTLIDQFLLEVAKLSDPSSTGGNQNLTIESILETVDWPPDVLSELKGLIQPVRRFRGYIKKARNKLLAHSDKKTIRSGRTLGAFPPGEDKKVMDALEEMCQLMHKASFGVTYGQMGHSSQAVSDIVIAMRKTLAFDKLLARSEGEERQRLHQYLSDARRGLSQ